MPHYHIWTIGCQMNKAESERLGSLLEERGYQSIAEPEDADIVIVNSCVVRESAESRVTNKLHTLRHLKKQHPQMTIAVTGCFVDSDETALKKAYPHVDYFFKAGDLPQWIDDIRPRELLPERPPVSVYVPIMQGCNNFCSYCIVPFRRGKERSRPVAEISTEAAELVGRGAREIVLVGQNVDSYGQDLAEKPDLADLLGTLQEIDGLFRLRFLTNHPKDMSHKLIEQVGRLPKVCPHLNLPVQAGDDATLELMKRGYTVDRYRGLIADIRRTVPNIALSTDIIVGFPSETVKQFQHTVDLLQEIRFDAVHVACYSTRSGTFAARHFTDDVPPTEKSRRLGVVERLQEKIATEINDELLGQTVEVLVEGRTKGKWHGRTRSDKLVFFHAPGDYVGQLTRVNIDRASPWSLQGKPVIGSGQGIRA
jgi:tRNA-2-methylthio-N6-dimethylallyladenosine synthase